MKKFSLILLFVSSILISKTRDEIIKDIKDQDIIAVDFVFSDILGNIKTVKIPAQTVPSILKSGLKFDGSSVPGCSEITSSDMHLEPDLNTWRLVPSILSNAPQGLIICDVCISENEPYQGDPRQMLKTTTNKLKENGIRFLTGVELEFYLLDENDDPCDEDHYFDFSGNLKLNDLIMAFFEAFNEARIDVVKEHHEVSIGQFEFVLGHNDALEVADQVLLAKYLIKTIAAKYALKANFMAKPIYGINGSGMHIHYSIYDELNHRNLFYDADKELYLSDNALSFIAGNLKHIRDLSSLFNGTVNSYKRLVPGYEAPIFICWGSKNRSSLIRIPLVNKEDANAVRAEIRCPDPKCNPYLALHGLLISGLNGIENNLVPVNSVSKNLYKLIANEIAELNIQSLPSNLKEAINCFENSEFVNSNFNSTFISQFLKLKKSELRSFETAVTDWEIESYS